jgi:hypothetical protein
MADECNHLKSDFCADEDQRRGPFLGEDNTMPIIHRYSHVARITEGNLTVVGYGPTIEMAHHDATLRLNEHHRRMADTGQQHDRPRLPDCLTCGDTGYTDAWLRGGGSAIAYTCDCEAGLRQEAIEEEYWQEMERDYAEAQYEQQTAGYF